jgi:hypothetical protein
MDRGNAMTDEKAREYFLKSRVGGNCAFGYSHPEVGFIEGGNTACHSGFKMPKGGTAFYSSLFKGWRTNKQIEMEWFSYVLGPYSPWRTALKNTEIFYDDKGAPLFFRNDGDVPLFTAFSLALACRTENAGNIEAWRRLHHEGGFGRIEALYLSSIIHCNDGKWAYYPFVGHGYPFHPKKLSYKKLVTKTPSPSHTTFDSAENGIYCNKIWDHTGKQIIPDICPPFLQVQPKYSGLFKAFKKPFEDNKENAMKQGKELFKALRDWKDVWGST